MLILLLAVLPPLLVDIGTAALVFTAVGAAIGAAFRWIINPFFFKPFINWFHENRVKPELDGINTNVDEVKHLIVYHLGGNGKTIPVRDRLLIVEEHVRAIDEKIANIKQEVRDIENERHDQ